MRNPSLGKLYEVILLSSGQLLYVNSPSSSTAACFYENLKPCKLQRADRLDSLISSFSLTEGVSITEIYRTVVCRLSALYGTQFETHDLDVIQTCVKNMV